jgi:hypothetical protein
MAAETRLQREPPRRTGPNRRAAKEPPQADPVRTVNGLEHGIKAAGLLARAADAAARGVVEQGVDTAYAVIDEYMTRGRNAAGRYGMSRPHTGQSGQWSYPSPGMQLMRMWADWVSCFVPAGPMNMWGNVFAADPCARPGTVKVEVEVASLKPAKVVVDLHSGADGLQLKAYPVGNPTEKALADLLDLEFSTCPGRVTVRVAVPDDHSTGSYAFVVRDTDQRDQGDLRVHIMDKP